MHLRCLFVAALEPSSMTFCGMALGVIPPVGRGTHAAGNLGHPHVSVEKIRDDLVQPEGLRRSAVRRSSTQCAITKTGGGKIRPEPFKVELSPGSAMLVFFRRV